MAVGSSPSFGDRLRLLRVAAGLSQEELAERAGMTAAAIGMLERSERRHPYPHTLQALAEALGLSPTDRAALFMAVPQRGRGAGRGTAAGISVEYNQWSQPPSPLTPLVGRQRDIAIITGLLSHGDARMVTLTGPGGVGKTRLAIEVGQLLRGSIEIGPVWVELAPVREIDLLLPTVARSLGLPEGTGQDVSQTLESYLGPRRSLLVLDNFEHLLAAAPLVSALLARCPFLSALVTSREALRVRGEHELQLLPLGLPALGASGNAAGVALSEAGELFLQRVRAVSPRFEMADDDAGIVADICARLDGLPLALELAAAQLKYMSLATLLVRLKSRLALLEGGPRDLPARQQSLRATTAWSHDLLGEPEQRLFRRLAVFVGGFTLEAAQAVCSPGELSTETARRLPALVDKSLLAAIQGSTGETRYVMLETIREYAQERLAASGEEGAVAQRHAGYFRHLAETAEPHLTSASREPWLRRLDADVANLRAALDWSAARGDPSVGLGLVSALAWFWALRGYVKEGTHWADLLLALPVQSGGTGAQGGALYAAAVMAFKREDHAAARRYSDESIGLLRISGDRRRLAIALAGAGLVATAQRDLDAAIEFHLESLSLFREQNDRWGIAYALANLGDPHFQRGDLGAASRCYAESLERFELIDDPWGRAINHHTLGNVAWAQGDVAAARGHYSASVDLTRSIKNDDMARGMLGLAATTLREGAAEEAQQLLAESLEIWQTFGSRAGIAVCLAGMASVQVSRGDFQEAARLFGAAEAQGRGRPSPYVVDADMFAGYFREAREHLDEPTFARAFAEGEAMALEEAIDLAYQEDVGS